MTVDPRLEIPVPDVAPVRRQIMVADIVRVVAQEAGVTVRDILRHDRHRHLVFPRHVALFVAVRITDFSLPHIGRAVGGRDHSSVLYAAGAVTARLDAGEPETVHLVARVLSRLEADSLPHATPSERSSASPRPTAWGPDPSAGVEVPPPAATTRSAAPSEKIFAGLTLDQAAECDLRRKQGWSIDAIARRTGADRRAVAARCGVKLDEYSEFARVRPQIQRRA